VNYKLNYIAQNKKSLRKKALKLRAEQQNKEELSTEIFKKVYNLEEFLNADVVLTYIDIKSEVRTKSELSSMLNFGKKIAIPYISLNKKGTDRLELFHLEDENELEQGSFGVLEPAPELIIKSKIIHPSLIDFAMIPGVAFDKTGNRLGYGKGFYDKLLLNLREGCLTVGLGYQCQVFDLIPVEDHDISLDLILTED